MFDLKTLAVIKKIKVPSGGLDGIMFDEYDDKVILTNHSRPTGTLVAIDPDSGDIVGTAELEDTAPEGAAPNGKGWIYVNNEEKNTIQVVDVKSLEGDQVVAACGVRRPDGNRLRSQFGPDLCGLWQDLGRGGRDLREGRGHDQERRPGRRSGWGRTRSHTSGDVDGPRQPLGGVLSRVGSAFRSGAIMSIGSGNTMVVFLSAPITVSVSR